MKKTWDFDWITQVRPKAIVMGQKWNLDHHPKSLCFPLFHSSQGEATANHLVLVTMSVNPSFQAETGQQEVSHWHTCICCGLCTEDPTPRCLPHGLPHVLQHHLLKGTFRESSWRVSLCHVRHRGTKACVECQSCSTLKNLTVWHYLVPIMDILFHYF